jgi:hypothetical protein
MIRHMAEQEIVRMLTTREVADRLNANPGTIRMWCINGTFPNAKQKETERGPVWFIPETDLRGFTRRGRGRPDQFGIYSPSYNRAAASPKWDSMTTDERIELLISEIQRENIEKNDPLPLPDAQDERRNRVRRILARFEKGRAKEQAAEQNSSPAVRAKSRPRKALKDTRKKGRADRKDS